MISVRCSSLPVVSRCSAAATPPALAIDAAGPEALLGTVTHQCLADAIQTGGPDPDRWDRLARRAGADPEQVQFLAGEGWRAWERQLREHFPEPMTERYLILPLRDGAPEVALTGHLDVSAGGGGEVRCLDWKAGHVEADPWEQVKGYLWLLLAAHPEATTAYGAVCWLRSGTVEGRRWTREELAGWWEDLAGRLLERREVYSPGEQCRWCPRAAECPAKRALLEQALTVLISHGDGPIPLCEPPLVRGPLLEGLLVAVRHLERMAEGVAGLIKADVAAHGGRLPLPDGRELALVPQTREEIRYREGYGVLLREVGSALEDCLRVNKGAAEAAVKAQAPRGRKHAAWKELLAALDEAGALERKVHERLEVRAATPQLEHTDDDGNGEAGPGHGRPRPQAGPGD